MKLLSASQRCSLQIWWETLTNIKGWKQDGGSMFISWVFALFGGGLFVVAGLVVWAALVTQEVWVLILQIPVAGYISYLGVSLFLDMPYIHPSGFAAFSATAARVMCERGCPDEKDKILEGLKHTKPKHFPQVMEDLLFDYDQKFLSVGIQLLQRANSQQQAALGKNFLKRCMVSDNKQVRQAAMRAVGRGECYED